VIQVLGLLVASSNPLHPLETALHHVLNWLHFSVGLPWAWSIVALTIMVRILLVPLTVRQIHSMQALQRHAPQMKEIQKKYKGDRQKMNEELMKFYKENHINPAASCLPMLAQFPVFISLYFVLKHFAKHPPCPGHAGAAAQFCVAHGDFSWLGYSFVPSIAAHADAHWSGYLLLAIYAASQISSTYFMSATMDKTQRTLMMVLPLFFITFLLKFPVGLVIYWVTTNLWTVGQGIITRRLVPKTPAPQILRRSSRTPPSEPPDGGNGAKVEKPAPAPSSPSAQRPPQTPRTVKRKKKGGARK
jgi:YidC/Oxa1 family membrane protein insertase